MAHRYLISQDSPALYITVVTNNRLPVFQKDPMKELHPSQPGTRRAGGTSDGLQMVQCSNMAGLSSRG